MFCETQREKEAVVRDGAAETGRGWIMVGGGREK